MASKYDKMRQELGIAPNDSTMSKYDQERLKYGIHPDRELQKRYNQQAEQRGKKMADEIRRSTWARINDLAESVEKKKETTPERKPSDKETFLSRTQKSLWNNVIEPVYELPFRFAASAASNISAGTLKDERAKEHFEQLGMPEGLKDAIYGKPENIAEKAADVSGELGSEIALFIGPYKAASKVVTPALSGLKPTTRAGRFGKRALEEAIKGGLAEGAVEAGKEVIDSTVNDDTLQNRLTNIGQKAALGATIDAGLYGLGKGVKAGADKLGITERISDLLRRQPEETAEPIVPLSNETVRQRFDEALQQTRRDRPNVAFSGSLNRTKKLPGEITGEVSESSLEGQIETSSSPDVPDNKLKEIVNRVKSNLDLTQPVSRISTIPKRIKEKYVLDRKPENVGDVIDVGGRPDRGRLTWEKIRTAVIDEFTPLQRATKQIAGKNLPIAEDPYKIAWLSRGWKGKADTKLQYGIMDEKGNLIGKSLRHAVEPVRGNLDALRRYAVALRALEYQEAGLESGITKEMAEDAIKRYGTKEVKQAYKNLQEYITNMNKATLVRSGIWSEDKLKKLREEQPNYVPMFRTREKGVRDRMESATSKRFGNVTDPTKKRTGSKRPIVDPIESIIKQTYKNQAIAERNNVMRTLVELAEKNPDNPIIRRVKAGNTKAIQKEIDNTILKPTDDPEKQLNEILEEFTPKKVDGKRNVFTVMRNGKAEQWQILDDQLAEVIAGLNNEAANFVVNLLGRATGILKAGLVLAPDFVIKNLVRDQLSAFAYSRYGFIPIWDTLSGLASALRKDGYFYKWMNSGGANGAWVSLERNYLQDQIRQLTQPGVRRIKQNPIEWLRKLSELSEQATRLGEFKRGIKKGASVEEAALASRDITLDFSRIGSKTKSVNKSVAFFNVAIQSLDKIARQFKERPVATTAKAITSITFPSVLLYALNYKDPRYQELPQWEKDTYWHVFLGDEVLRIPKPFELGVIFGTYPERQLQAMVMDDPKAMEGMLEQIRSGFTPSILPTLFAPWIEAYANKDMFTKAPIVPMREQRLEKEDQYGPYTSESAKILGDLTNQSPRIIENYITGYTGTLGRYGLQGIDKLLAREGLVNPPPRPEPGLSEKPVIRSFFSRGLEGASKSVDDFYKELDRLTRERNSARKSKELYGEESKYRRFRAYADVISDQHAMIRRILEDRDMTPEEKRRRINEINLRIINLARKAQNKKPITGEGD